MSLEAAVEAGQHAHQRKERPEPLTQWAKKNCKTCWGRGWSTQVMGKQRNEKICNCIINRVIALKKQIAMF